MYVLVHLEARGDTQVFTTLSTLIFEAVSLIDLELAKETRRVWPTNTKSLLPISASPALGFQMHTNRTQIYFFKQAVLNLGLHACLQAPYQLSHLPGLVP